MERAVIVPKPNYCSLISTILQKLVHPECRPEVIKMADMVFSTSGMIKHVCSAPEKEFVIGRETQIPHHMEKQCPEKICYPLSPQAICTNMERTDLTKVCESLELL